MRDVTLNLIILNVIAWALYDVAVVKWWGVEASISAVLWSVSREHPVVALMLGILIGHALWPNVR